MSEHFKLAAETIHFLYRVNQESLKRKISYHEWHSVVHQQLGLDHVHLLFSQNRLFQWSDLSVEPSYTVFGLAARLKKDHRVGLIAFRGTQLDAEFINDARSLLSVDLSKPLIDKEDITVASSLLEEEQRKKIRSGCLVAKGFLEVYTGLQGASSKSKCVCVSKCRKATPNQMIRLYGNNPLSLALAYRRDKSMYEPKCSTVPLRRMSNIQQEAHQKSRHQVCGEASVAQRELCDPKLDMEPFHHILLKAIQDLTTQGVTSFIITGHSLGAAVATICAFHLSSVDQSVHSLITFASPRVGNATFAASLHERISERRIFRISNTDDLVTNVPLPYTPPVYYVHVGDSAYTFSTPKHVSARSESASAASQQSSKTVFTEMVQKTKSYTWGLSYFLPFSFSPVRSLLRSKKAFDRVVETAAPLIRRAHELQTYLTYLLPEETLTSFLNT